MSYSSPQLATIDGVAQVLLANATGLTSVAPADGKVLWEHKWRGFPIVQPAFTTDGDVARRDRQRQRHAPPRGRARRPGRGPSRSAGPRRGSSPTSTTSSSTKATRTASTGSILACIDLANGERKWKGGRYGNGQLVLLAEQDLLLVLSEEGELALVSATPDRFTEVARVPALQGKTWNHPALAGDILLVRNGEEMVAFRLSLAGPVAELRLRQELP